jgi:hypothetical protein
VAEGASTRLVVLDRATQRFTEACKTLKPSSSPRRAKILVKYTSWKSRVYKELRQQGRRGNNLVELVPIDAMAAFLLRLRTAWISPHSKRIGS